MAEGPGCWSQSPPAQHPTLRWVLPSTWPALGKHSELCPASESLPRVSHPSGGDTSAYLAGLLRGLNERIVDNATWKNANHKFSEWMSSTRAPTPEREASGYGPPRKDGSTPHREGPSAAWRPRTGQRLTGPPQWPGSSAGQWPGKRRQNRWCLAVALCPHQAEEASSRRCCARTGLTLGGANRGGSGNRAVSLGGKGGLSETWKCPNHLALAQVKWSISSRNWSLWTKLYSEKYY